MLVVAHIESHAATLVVSGLTGIDDWLLPLVSDPFLLAILESRIPALRLNSRPISAPATPPYKAFGAFAVLAELFVCGTSIVLPHFCLVATAIIHHIGWLLTYSAVFSVKYTRYM